MDAVLTGLKETVGKIKPKMLAKLPVKKNKCLEKIFTTIYGLLYYHHTWDINHQIELNKSMENTNGMIVKKKDGKINE